MTELFTAKTVEEAKALAVQKFGKNESEIKFEIINEGKKGFLGIGAVDAQVKATVADAPKPLKPIAPVVKEEVKMEKMLVSGVAVDRNVARISVIGLLDQPGVAFKLFNHLARYNINVDVILQSVGRDGTKDISFTVAADDCDEAVEIVKRHGEGSLKCQKIEVEKEVAKVSVVGAGMQSHSGTASKMFGALYEAGINISMISTSEITISVLIDKELADKAVSAVHKAFFG